MVSSFNTSSGEEEVLTLSSVLTLRLAQTFFYLLLAIMLPSAHVCLQVHLLYTVFSTEIVWELYTVITNIITAHWAHIYIEVFYTIVLAAMQLWIILPQLRGMALP